jgi:predicted alpha/beta-hydrolase family hydrolase
MEAGEGVVTMYLTTGPTKAKHTYLLSHGAGGPMDSAMLTTLAETIAARGIRVVRFEFPYMAARRAGTKKGGPPDRAPVLLETWRRVIEDHGGGAKVVIGGQSMGGRMASMIADEAGARALVCFSYPWHPPGKPEQPRTAHLEHLRTPALILQGTRDPFGSPEEVASYVLSPSIRVEWMEGGDHSLRGRVAAAAELAAAFILGM